MDLGTLLQVIIGLIFIYLIVSLVVSELQEQLTAFSQFRARNLKQAIKTFSDTEVVDALYDQNDNSLFAAYNQYTNPILGKSFGPSYIEPKIFAESLIMVINKKIDKEIENAKTGNYTLTINDSDKLKIDDLLIDPQDSNVGTPPIGPQGLNNVKKGIITKLNNIKNVKTSPIQNPEVNVYPITIGKLIEVANLTQLKKDGATFNNFVEEIANTFSQVMERTSGVYKRNAKGVSLILGLITALMFNIDTLYIVNQLYTNPGLRNSLDTAATELNDQNKPCFDTAQQKGTPKEIKDATDECVKTLQSNLDALKASPKLSPLPVGWKDGKLFHFNQDQGWGQAILGWFISAIAISMGAPFWFDLLGKFINVRNTVKPLSPSETPPPSQQ